MLKQTKLFEKDIQKLKLSDKHYTKFIVYLGKLAEGEGLPPEAKDHLLLGEWQGYREFHVSGDILVIYKDDGESISLARVGSHSQLFE